MGKTNDMEQTDEDIKELTHIYWTAVTVVYLVISFLTGAWGTTWLIWPVACLIGEILAYVRHRKARMNDVSDAKSKAAAANADKCDDANDGTSPDATKPED